MASSLEEVSGTPGNEPSGGAPPTDHFGVFKDFDFLEYESESIEVIFYSIIKVTTFYFDEIFFTIAFSVRTGRKFGQLQLGRAPKTAQRGAR